MPLVREKASKPDERKVTDVQYKGSLTTIRKVGLLNKGGRGEGVWTDAADVPQDRCMQR